MSDLSKSDDWVSSRLAQAKTALENGEDVKAYKHITEARDELITRTKAVMDVDVSTYFDRGEIDHVISEAETESGHDRDMRLIIGYANES